MRQMICDYTVLNRGCEPGIDKENIADLYTGILTATKRDEEATCYNVEELGNSLLSKRDRDRRTWQGGSVGKSTCYETLIP